MIRAHIPTMPTADMLIPYLRKIDEVKWYSNFGPLYEELCSRLSAYFKVPESHLCLIGNATLGLQAIAENLNADDSVDFEIPSFTFAASPSALAAAKKNFRFIDVDSEMRCVPSQDAQVVMDVLPFGENLRHANWMDPLSFLIIDAAASFDSLQNFGEKFSFTGAFAIVVSFHATKLIGAGEGAVVIASSPDLINQIKLWQNFGFDNSGMMPRISKIRGTNAKMSEYNCAVALASLDQWFEIRADYESLLRKALEISSSAGFEVQSAMKKGFVSPYWILRTRGAHETLQVIKECADQQIETRLWWQTGCHEMPAFRNFRKSDLSNTEVLSRSYVGIPFHRYLDDIYWEKISVLLKRVRSIRYT